MMKFWRQAFVFGLASTNFAGLALATETSIKLKSRVIESCTTFSTWTADFQLLLRTDSIPWGSEVEVVYGFRGWAPETSGQTVNWANLTTFSLPAVAANEWFATFSHAVAARGIRWLDRIEFVVKVVLPDGTNRYIKPNSSAFGYYAADFMSEAAHGCSADEAPWTPLTLISVEQE
jgi:hypothetical protein